MKSHDKRIEKLENKLQPDDREKITGIDFIIPGEAVTEFGKTFEDMEACLAYCDENDIPYKEETAAHPHGPKSYIFPTAENADKGNPMNFRVNEGMV
jgi:hypothetical protein